MERITLQGHTGPSLQTSAYFAVCFTFLAFVLAALFALGLAPAVQGQGGPQTDLVISKDDSPDPVIAGETLIYTLSITNTGPVTATGVIVTDTLPLGVTYGSGPMECTDASGTVTCTLGPLVPGMVMTFTISADVAVTTTGTIANTAIVAGNEADPNLGNNSWTEFTTVNPPVELVARIGGGTVAVAVQSGYAYIGVGPRLVILDVLDPANPAVVGQTAPLPGVAIMGVAVVGDYAYVGDGSGGLRIINVSAPQAPTEVGFYETPGEAWGVAVAGDYAYVANGYDGLRIINVSDPLAPTQASLLDTPGSAYDVAVVGGYAYVADGYEGLHIINVSDPAAPTQVGLFDTPGSASGVAVVGDYAYVGDGSGGLRIINVSDSAVPTQAGFYDPPGGYWDGAWHVAVAGNHAYVANQLSGLRIINVSDPANPTEDGIYNTPGSATGVAVAGGYAYVADWGGSLRIINVSDPQAPTEAGFYYDAPGVAEGVAVVGDYAYVAAGSGGLRIINVSDLATLTEAGFYDTPGQAVGVAVVGDYAYVGDGYEGLHIIDVSDPVVPTQAGFYDTPEYAYEPAVVGDYAYVADHRGGLRIIDVSDPAAPTEADFYDTPGYAAGVAVAGDYAYVADGGSGLRIINVADPPPPAEAGSYDTPGFAYDVAVAGDYAYVADGDSGLRIINVSDPAAPTEAGFYDTPGSAYGVVVVGDYAYVADSYEGLRIINVSDPAAPTQAGFYDTPGRAYDVAVAGDYTYVADWVGGLVILRFQALVDALYVWRAPRRDGTPITVAEAERLADFAVAEGIRTIYYDNYGCGPDITPDCPSGAEQQVTATLTPTIQLLHEHGLRVEALYTDNSRIADVVAYNSVVGADERFDGIRLNIEAGSFPSNGQYDPGELFYDFGSDGVQGTSDAGEGNGKYDAGEPFDDFGLDGIDGTLDPGEGNGRYNRGEPLDDFGLDGDDGTLDPGEGNSQYDPGELFYDFGSDGVQGTSDAGEGNGKYDAGEPFDDFGLDGVDGTNDPGEGNGQYDPGEKYSDQGWWPGGGKEPTGDVDLEVYADAVSAANSLPVYVSISHHWDEPITYNGETKAAYEHILHIVSGVDMQTAQDTPEVIADITKEEVCYANWLGKPVHVTIETYDVVTHLGMNDFNTFFEEGEVGMKDALAAIDYTAPGVNAPCSDPQPTGFAYHFYRQSYGSPSLPRWAPDEDGDHIVDSVDSQPNSFSGDFSDVGLGGATTGTITDRGDQTFAIADATDPDDGVLITAAYYGGATPATVSACNAELSISAGDGVIVTCGSVTIEVNTGTVEITFAASDGTLATTSLGEGNALTFEPSTITFQAPPTNPDPVVVHVEGEELSLTPGQDVDFNRPPEVEEVTAPVEPVQVNTEISASADFSDPDVPENHTAVWDWGDGSQPTVIEILEGSRSVNASHTYTTPGVYTVKLTVTDSLDAFGESVFQYIVVYDPAGGFVTGGGWIDSPTGAYTPDPSLTGRANFGFVAKYKKGASVPSGNTQFRFKAGNLNFHSTSYQWLVVAGPQAKFKGEGTINGGGAYGFMLTARDGQVNGGGGVDRFRIKIWDKATGDVVYDNQMGDDDDADASDTIEGGSIVIHKK